MSDFWSHLALFAGLIVVVATAGAYLFRRRSDRADSQAIPLRSHIGDIGEFIECRQPCPFCRSSDLVLDVDSLCKHHVACDRCGIWGPAGDDPADAVAIWDKR